MSEQLILRYILTMDDHMKAQRAILLGAKPIRLVLYLCSPILVLVGILLLIFSNRVSPLTFVAIMCFIFAIYNIFYFFALLPLMSRRRLQKLKALEEKWFGKSLMIES